MSRDISDNAQKLLESRFLAEAERPDAEAHVDRDLSSKVAHLHGHSETIRRLRALSSEATEIWKNRGRLERKHLLYLTAGLLYFISPVDAITDLIPVLGYVDDVAVLAWILSQIRPAALKLKSSMTEIRDGTVDRATDQLVEKGREALNEIVDQRSDELLDKLDQAADDIIQRYVAAVAIGLWGTTTAAALSLAISLITGGYTREWMAYVGITSALVLIWNIGLGLAFLHQYRQLDERWQQRLPRIIGARVGRWKHLLAVALPILAFGGLTIAHLVLNR